MDGDIIWEVTNEGDTPKESLAILLIKVTRRKK
jgi:hypothetical protein